jgi:hypothetical protein
VLIIELLALFLVALWLFVLIPLTLRTLYRVMDDRRRFLRAAMWAGSGFIFFATGFVLTVVSPQPDYGVVAAGIGAELFGTNLVVFRREWSEVNRRWWGWFPPWGSPKWNYVFTVIAGVFFCFWGVFAVLLAAFGG